ncbi:Mediator-associated protein 1 [Spatholobus suberectus]|nr:Mediator-associated protein 1 [Spatholobus suberectus]
MASDLNDAVFPEEDLDDDDETQEDEEEDDEDDDVLGEPDDDETEPPPSVLAAVTVALPGSAASKTASIPVAVADSSPKRQRTEQIEEKKVLDDSRRLFQRLWTDEDEIGLLQGFLEYTAQRGSSHHNDTALFYDQIKSKLQLGFNKNQLVEKLRRLKKKFRNVLNKISSGKEFSFKSPHDRASFEISRRIWSNTAPITGPVEDDDEINPNANPNFGHSAKTPLSRKRSRSRSEKRELNYGSVLNKDNNCIGNSNNNNNKDNENCSSRNNVQVLIEETVRSCLSPVLKQLASSGMGLGSAFGFGGRGFALNPLPMPLSFLNLGIGEMAMDEKWRKQQILELQVYSKRLELVQDEIEVALEELRSAGGG